MSESVDLKEIASFIGQMKADGAVNVRVGDVEVTFAPEFAPMDPPRPPTREERDAAERYEQRLRFAHSEGFPDELEQAEG